MHSEVIIVDMLSRIIDLMEHHKDTKASLARNAGIPYTTIDGLFKRGCDNAYVSTARKISNYYGVTLDYLVMGVDALSTDALDIAAKYERLDKHGRELVELVINHEVKRVKQENGHESPSVREALGEPSEIRAVHPDSAQGE